MGMLALGSVAALWWLGRVSEVPELDAPATPPPGLPGGGVGSSEPEVALSKRPSPPAPPPPVPSPAAPEPDPAGDPSWGTVPV